MVRCVDMRALFHSSTVKYFSKYSSLITIFTIVLSGLLYRLIGISSQLSYWNDESHSALMSRGILLYGSPVTEIGVGNGLYQLAFYYLTAIFFKLLGVTEFAGRLPSVIAGVILIILLFFIVKKLIGIREALIASFIVAFSQIQLAWSTQLRPYIWLEIFTLLIVYFCIQSYRNKKKIIDTNLLISVALFFIAFLFHGTAVINLLFIFIIIMIKSFQQKKYIGLFFLIPLSILAFFMVQNAISHALVLLLKMDFRIYHYFKFLTVNYWWLGLGSIIGIYALYFKDKVLFYILPSFTIIYFIISILKVNTQYVRYSLPAFAIVYILFSAGLIFLFNKDKVFKKDYLRIFYHAIILIIFIFLPIIQRKIIIIPQHYYSINADIRENPIVDYKSAFLQIDKIITQNKLDKRKLLMMDAWNDRIPWYMPKQQFVLLARDIKGVEIDPYYGEKIIGTTELFDFERNKFPYGIVIVENWPSQTSPELQEYIRKTLKHEFDVNNLPYNEDDKWSISVYSWGI